MSSSWGVGGTTPGVVAFFYINNFSAFPVGLEEPPKKSESQKIRRRKNRGLVGLDLRRFTALEMSRSG